MDGPRDVQRTRSTALVRGDPRRVRARRDVALDDIDLFVYHQANARILRAVAERLELPDASASSTTSASSATRRRRRSRSRSPRRAGRPAAARRRACCWPPSAPASRGARTVARVGRRRMSQNSRPQRLRARHRRLARASAPRSRIALAADGWPVARQLPLRRGGRPRRSSTAIEAAGGRAVAIAGRRRRRRRRADDAARRRRGRRSARCWRSSTTPASRADGLAPSARRRATGTASSTRTSPPPSALTRARAARR